MREIDFVGCIVLCALALWMESLRSVRAMRKQAEEFQAGYENFGRPGGQGLPDGERSRAVAWMEMSEPDGFLKPGSPRALDANAPKAAGSWNTPGLYLSLALILWLLLL